MNLKTLIDKCVTMRHDTLTLAAELGVSRSRVYEWKGGHRPCPIEVQIRLCDIAGLDDHAAREHLREAAKAPAGKSLVHGVAAFFAPVALFAAVLAGCFTPHPAMAHDGRIDNV